jgi:hypothetical protein
MINMKKFAFILVMILFATLCFAEWQIVGISTAYFSQSR